MLDRGSTHGIVAGSPVINEAGVLGQVTRVYPLSSEVTLLTDKDAAVPILNIRTQAMLALNRPCEVLVMLEAAHDALQTTNAPRFRQQ